MFKFKANNKIIDIHSGLSGLVVENTKVKVGNKIEEFDGMWASSLTNTAAKGSLISRLLILQRDFN